MNSELIKHIDADNPIQKIDEDMKSRLMQAQSNLLHLEIGSAGELCERAFADLRISCSIPKQLYKAPLSTITNLGYSRLNGFFSDLLHQANFPEQSIILHSANLAQRLQLIQAFDKPDDVIEYVEDKVAVVAEKFPKKASDIERGRNPGDVLDPYILAATQYLICGGNFEKAIESTVAHKALMMVEGLIGHLHEDVIGLMRGNVRVPEPRGKDQETLDPESNPFPGADVIQPPWNSTRSLRFHQLKSKTGSAKGGDGRRLGEQLQQLQNLYGGDIYYHALIGNTLKGHRSKAGVEKAAPKVVVLVGDASFHELTGTETGPQLLLRVYQSAFTNVSRRSGYFLDVMAAGIAATFMEQAEKESDGFLEVILKDVTSGPAENQDSRLYNQQKRR
ncbi:MAG: hypothetical protein L0229_07940 [Blastocatellia bacterium]|nr:hypothetical protein [Blastocatellia bacterium]